MDDPKAKLLTRVRESTNVLVTVSNNPSLDQLSGAIGLTLLLNKLGKHATAVFSGEVPSIIEYLNPEETIEKTTDSLRDFIIALDKSKADKLRYKVEDKMVKIFITPYRTSITENDLEYSQGDFNVDVVIALGVHEQKDLDQAITSHGRILHDATVSSINNRTAGNLGSINWVDEKASSLCEMLYSLSQELKPDALDAQMATALLTGIVSETKRFANEKTTARSMAISSQLVAAGANQQLVAAKLQQTAPEPPTPKKEDGPKPVEPPKPEDPDKIFKPAPKVKEDKNDGMIQVQHAEEQTQEEKDLEEIRIDDHGVLYRPSEEQPAGKKPEPPEEGRADKDEKKGTSRIVLEPPTLGGKLTANSEPEGLDPAVDPLGTMAATDQPLLSHDSGPASTEDIPTLPLPDPSTVPVGPDPNDNTTLDDLEKSVNSPHQANTAAPQAETPPAGTPDLNAARDAVLDAVNSGVDLSPPPPRFDLNAQPGLELDQLQAAPPAPEEEAPLVAPPVPPTTPGEPGMSLPPFPPAPGPTPIFPPGEPGLPGNLTPPAPPTDNTAPQGSSPLSPPPVPPPMMPPSFLPEDPSKKADDENNSGAIPGVPL